MHFSLQALINYLPNSILRPRLNIKPIGRLVENCSLIKGKYFFFKEGKNIQNSSRKREKLQKKEKTKLGGNVHVNYSLMEEGLN